MTTTVLCVETHCPKKIGSKQRGSVDNCPEEVGRAGRCSFLLEKKLWQSFRSRIEAGTGEDHDQQTLSPLFPGTQTAHLSTAQNKYSRKKKKKDHHLAPFGTSPQPNTPFHPPATNILNNLHHRDPTPAATTALKRGPRRPRSGQAARLTRARTYIMRTLARQPCLPASLSDLAQQRRSIIMNGERSQADLNVQGKGPHHRHRSPFKVRLHPHETRDWGFCRRRPVRLACMAHV